MRFRFLCLCGLSEELPLVITATVGLTSKVIGNDLFSIGNGVKAIGKVLGLIGCAEV